MPVLACLSLLIASMDFYSEGPYDTRIPRPESILGYTPGARHTTYFDQERVIQAIAQAGGHRARLESYGASTEGRPLRVLVFSSPENLARLESIKRDLATLANPPAGQDLGEVRKRTPAVVWVNECIHGNETASFESAMWLSYTLAASKSKRISDLLRDSIVIINPAYNPDGHERYVVHYNSIATGSSVPGAFENLEPSTIQGRGNHYRFDMNRDRVSMTQLETRQEVQAFLKWNPHVYVDQHGQVETYFFPPNPMAVNANVDRPRFNRWTDIFGRATGKAFDKNGFLYFVKDTFDLYYPGYLDSWTSLSGAIGMTHETDGGRLLRIERRDGSTLTLRDGIEKHFTSALAVAEAAAKNRERLLADYEGFKRGAVTGKFAGKFQRVVIEGDSRKLARLRSLLTSHGIRSGYAMTSFEANDAHDYWSSAVGKQSFRGGSLVVDIAQSQGPLAKALLEPNETFEPEFIKAQQAKKKTAPEGEQYPGPDGAEFYDLTGWALPYAWDLKAWWMESAPKLEISDSQAMIKRAALADSPIGYILPYQDDQDILAVIGAMQSGIRASITTKPMKVDGTTYPVGSFLFLGARNEPGFKPKLESELQKRGAYPVAIGSAYPDEERYGPGSSAVQELRPPKIGVIFGNQGLAAVGPMWYLMEREFQLPFEALSTNALNSTDLSRYTTLVIPRGAGVSVTSKLRDWVSAGGSLVVLSGVNWALGQSNFVDLSEQKGEFQSLPGALFRADLDVRSFLSYGYGVDKEGKRSIAFPVSGSTFYLTRKSGGSVVTFSKDEKVKKLLTGWAWPDETEKALRGTVAVQDVPVGRGHVILFTEDPTERAMWNGLHRMILNAMLLGPG